MEVSTSNANYREEEEKGLFNPFFTYIFFSVKYAVIFLALQTTFLFFHFDLCEFIKKLGNWDILHSTFTLYVNFNNILLCGRVSEGLTKI